MQWTVAHPGDPEPCCYGGAESSQYQSAPRMQRMNLHGIFDAALYVLITGVDLS